jgi:hypothetical protein
VGRSNVDADVLSRMPFAKGSTVVPNICQAERSTIVPSSVIRALGVQHGYAEAADVDFEMDEGRLFQQLLEDVGNSPNWER